MPLKQTFETALTDYSSTAKDKLGDLRFDQDGKAYRYVQNKTAGTTVVGQVGFWDPANAADFLTKVYAASTSLLPYMAGAFLATVPADYYCWVQVHGYNATLSFEGTTTDIAAGMQLIGVNGQTYLKAGAAAGTAVTYERHIQALEAYTTDAASTFTKKGFIRCM